MIFSRNPARRLRRALVCAVAFAALTACGGGTSQYDPFVAQRFLAFGDEWSTLGPLGVKYSINGYSSVTNPDGSTTDTPDCTTLKNWVQALADLYGFVFAECNPGNLEPKAFMRAFAGARVTDVKVQIDSQIAAGGFRDKDLVSVLAGANDIIDVYQQYPGRTEADLENELGARGKQLAQYVNLLVDLGTKVFLSNAPDMGLTPYALKQRSEFTDTDRAALLTRLSAAFNDQLGVNILLDGRYIGLVQTDLRMEQMVSSPATYGLVNVVSAACLDTVPPPLCTTKTLVDTATATNWMWSDDLHLSSNGQSQMSALAVDRARNNPF